MVQRKKIIKIKKHRYRLSKTKAVDEVASYFLTQLFSTHALCLNSNFFQVSFAHIFRISRSEQPAHNPGKRQYIKAKL